MDGIINIIISDIVNSSSDNDKISDSNVFFVVNLNVDLVSFDDCYVNYYGLVVVVFFFDFFVLVDVEMFVGFDFCKRFLLDVFFFEEFIGEFFFDFLNLVFGVKFRFGLKFVDSVLVVVFKFKIFIKKVVKKFKGYLFVGVVYVIRLLFRLKR